MRGAQAVTLSLLTLDLAGCGGGQSTLLAHSGPVGTIDTLWWVMLVGSAIVFAVVVALLAVGLLRRRAIPPEQRRRPSPGTTFVVIAGVVVPTIVLVALFVLTVDALPKTSPALGTTRLAVDVVGTGVVLGRLLSVERRRARRTRSTYRWGFRWTSG